MRIPLVCLACVLAVPGGRLFGDFLRGDANQDGTVNVSDAVAVLQYLFEGGGRLTCEDAADANDDGRIALTDVLAGLNALFRGTTMPSPGVLVRGPDPTCDALGCAASPEPTPAIVISEIDYNPSITATIEFIELYNRSSADIDVGGYRFTNGIDFTIPPATVIAAGGFLLVLKDPELSTWRRVPGPRVGPYDGWLADGGERLTLEGDCGGETLRFDDRPPWPLGADGYGRSLERIDYLAAADDAHSWRASTAARGTPGEPNSTSGVPTRPVITLSAVSPAKPRSTDEVQVSVVFDVPREALESATLHWETLALAVPALGEPLAMREAAAGIDWVRYEATVPPQPSQTLVRLNVEVGLAGASAPGGGAPLVLPHSASPNGFLSYFVYDFEVPAALPILWLFPRRDSRLPLAPRQRSAVVALEPAADAVLVFDGALLEPRGGSAGLNLKFLKGEEYRGDRTVNIMPETGNGGTGLLAPHMEHLGFDVWRHLGGLAPWADFYRVVESSNRSRSHTQRLVVEQVNERFLELNGVDPDGDLYKLDHKLGGWAKRTNLHTGMASLTELLASLRRGSIDERRAAMERVLDIDSVRLYSVLSVLIGNWDGFHNNLFAYRDTSPDGKWIVIPWDLDQVFEVSQWSFPLDFPRTGRHPGNPSVNRETGPISQPFHTIPEFHQAYLDDMKGRLESGTFSVESIGRRMAAVKARLLEDLELQESFLGTESRARRAQIDRAYDHMQSYMERRIPYLEEVLN